MKQFSLNLKTVFFCAVVALGISVAAVAFAQSDDPLPSWNEGPAKKAIVRFLKEVTTAGGARFVPPPERIAVFDNDGTLWAEQPMYFQMEFVFDRVKALAPRHPEWKQKQPFKAALDRDLKTLFAGTKHALLELMMATHYRQHHRGVFANRRGLDCYGEAPENRSSLHGDGLSADAGTARLSARKWLQDLHRVRRRY